MPEVRGTVRQWRGEQLLWAAVAALAFAGTAGVFVVGFFGADRIWPDPLSHSDGSLAVAAILAAAIVGWVSHLGVETYCSERPVVGGTVAGLLTGALAHPLMWFLWPLLPPTDGHEMFAFVMLIASMYSLLFVGWITAPMAMIAGGVVGVLRVGVERLTSRYVSGP